MTVSLSNTIEVGQRIRRTMTGTIGSDAAGHRDGLYVTTDRGALDLSAARVRVQVDHIGDGSLLDSVVTSVDVQHLDNGGSLVIETTAGCLRAEWSTSRGPRLWVVVPSYGGIEAPTTLALVGLSGIWSAAGGIVHMLTAGGPIVGLLRDEITASLVSKGVGRDDLVLWLDSDMSFDAAELVRWLDRVPHGAIVGVAGRKKQEPAVWCCELDDDPALAVPLPAHLSHLRVGTVGGACLALRGSTLARLWDAAVPYMLGQRELREVWRCGVFLTRDTEGSTPRRQFWGEDTGLCLLARSAGVSVLIDPSVWLGHHDGRTCYGGRLADGVGHTMDGRTVAEALGLGPREYRADNADNGEPR